MSLDTRAIVNSDWFKAEFPNFALSCDQNRKTKFSTKKHGFRLSTSVGGSVIGEGGDVLIVDDPISPLQAHSSIYRDKVFNWYNESFSTRLNDKKTGIKLIVMQRLHDDDLVGRIMRANPQDWGLVNIPLIAIKDEFYISENFTYFRGKGEYLHEARDGENEIAELKRQLGSYVFSAQYQQEPVVSEGSLIKANWIKRYDSLPEDPKYIIQSWDLAFTTKSYSDYSVCSTWFVGNDNNYYLAHVHRVQKEFPKLINDCRKLYDKWLASMVIVEDTVSSKAFIQELRHANDFKVISIRPKGDKLTRLAIASPAFESGRIHLPKIADWLVDYENEILSFPKSIHDDQVDSTTQFLSYIEQAQRRNSVNCIRGF